MVRHDEPLVNVTIQKSIEMRIVNARHCGNIHRRQSVDLQDNIIRGAIDFKHSKNATKSMNESFFYTVKKNKPIENEIDLSSFGQLFCC